MSLSHKIATCNRFVDVNPINPATWWTLGFVDSTYVLLFLFLSFPPSVRTDGPYVLNFSFLCSLRLPSVAQLPLSAGRCFRRTYTVTLRLGRSSEQQQIAEMWRRSMSVPYHAVTHFQNGQSSEQEQIAEMWHPSISVPYHTWFIGSILRIDGKSIVLAADDWLRFAQSKYALSLKLVTMT